MVGFFNHISYQAKGLGFMNQAQQDSHVDNNYKLQWHNSDEKIHPKDTIY